jgi:hypothetical protein
MGLSAGLLILGAGVAAAQSCNDDIGALQKKRNVHIEALNKMSKASKGKLDPIASCPRLRNLAAIEKEMLAYMEKNKNWCSIPDAIIEQVKGGAEKTTQVAGQACKIAAQARQMQQQAQQQMQAGAPPPPALPRGPL